MGLEKEVAAIFHVLVPTAKAQALRSAIVAHPVYAEIGETAKTGGHGLKRKCTKGS